MIWWLLAGLSVVVAWITHRVRTRRRQRELDRLTRLDLLRRTFGGKNSEE